MGEWVMDDSDDDDDDDDDDEDDEDDDGGGRDGPVMKLKTFFGAYCIPTYTYITCPLGTKAPSFYVKCPLHGTGSRSCSKQLTRPTTDAMVRSLMFWLLQGTLKTIPFPYHCNCNACTS